jgi:exonuclease III
MNLVSWNCRGLGSPSAVSNLKYLVRHHKIAILFLSETLVLSNKIEEIRYVLGFNSCFSVDRVGRSGGLAMFWNSSHNCQILDYSQNHISVEFTDIDRGNWQLTGYYGYPNGDRRRASWDLLRTLSHQSSLPWCIFGDFNDIMDDTEKRGSTSRSRWLINGFRQAVLDSGLSDVPVHGYPYTWFKFLGTSRAVEERFDRVLAYNNWFALFPNAKLETLVAPASNHYLIFLECSPTLQPQPNHRYFHFENAWRFEPGFNDFFNEKWISSGNDSVVSRLNCCADDLPDWSRTHVTKLGEESLLVVNISLFFVVIVRALIKSNFCLQGAR